MGLDDVQQEVARLQISLAGLQQLVAELLLENERLRHCCSCRIDQDGPLPEGGADRY